jgi:hypothetical protein
MVLNGQNGTVVIESNHIDVQGQVSGSGAVVLKATDASRDIVVGSVAGGSGNAMTISAASLQNLGGMESIVIGQQGADGHAAANAGKVTVGAFNTDGAVQVYGSTVTVQAGSGTHSNGGITLDGSAGVQVSGNLNAGSGSVQVSSASGAVRFDAGSNLVSSGNVDIRAAGSIAIGHIQADSVTLHSSGGSVAPQTTSGTPDIVANTVSIFGSGTAMHANGPAGGSLLIDADQIYVGSSRGSVFQETGPDGITRFYVLEGGELRMLAAGVGDVKRITQDPSAPAPAQQAAWEGLEGMRTVALPSSMTLGFPVASSLGTLNAGVSSYLSLNGSGTALSSGAGNGSLSASSLGLGDQLRQSFILGSSGLQSLSTGQVANDAASFDYWLEDLVI